MPIFSCSRNQFALLVRRKVKSILVRVHSGEGKTTTVANLAITYANLGKKHY